MGWFGFNAGKVAAQSLNFASVFLLSEADANSTAEPLKVVVLPSQISEGHISVITLLGAASGGIGALVVTAFVRTLFHKETTPISLSAFCNGVLAGLGESIAVAASCI